jgi:hypothetical protein
VNGDTLELKQKIHDALLVELVKKDSNGKFPNLLKLVSDGNFSSVKCSVDLEDKGCVDVVLTYPKHGASSVVEDVPVPGDVLVVGLAGTDDIAIELITDIDFDAGKKLEQVNRYKKGYKDVRVVIPEEYNSVYGQLFSMNDIKVHTWTGTRRWKGKYCRHITEVKDSSEQPIKCSKCPKRELFFIGFKDDVTFK